MPPVCAHEINTRIGQRIRQRREYWNISLWQLADASGLTIGEIEDYENGQGNISAAIVAEIAYHLQMPIAWFFD